LATFNSGYPIQQKGKTFAIPGKQSPEEGQAICGLSGTTLPNRKISPLLSGAYSFSARLPGVNLRVENVSVQTALSTDRRLAFRGNFHS